jgi:hypothetical protein
MLVRGSHGRLTVGPRTAAIVRTWSLRADPTHALGVCLTKFDAKLEVVSPLLLLQRPIDLALELDAGVWWTWTLDEMTVDPDGCHSEVTTLPVIVEH